MGQGLPVPSPGMVPWENLFSLPLWTGDDGGQALAQSWYLAGLSAPTAVSIPWTWLSGQLRFRQDKAITRATVSQSNGPTAVSVVSADEQIEFSANLDTANDVDAGNLAHFMTTYYDTARSRIAGVRMILQVRSVAEIWTILGVGIGDRVTITGTPTGWPTGATSFVVEGIRHSSAGGSRTVEWSTSPLIGEAIGSVGPFFRVGVSAPGGTDLLPW